jgi:4-diphosphocytidyl-2-C-methyl-D-erythritol kinase
VKSLNLTSYAKLNLYLKILGRRADNYHSILTLFERVSLSDQIRLKLLPQREIRISLSGLSVPQGPDNLAYQAASLLQRRFQVARGVQIHIRKHIPLSSGLGGGSSNAAVVLSGLNQLWRLNLKVKQLVALGRQIGSDVPFFLHNTSFACATHRGDEIKVLRLPVKLCHIIVVPRIKIASSLIYKKWDQGPNLDRKPLRGLTPPFQQGGVGVGKERAGLTNHRLIIRILKSALLKKDILLLSRLLFNSLEEVSTAMYPAISKARLALSDLGLEAISMSGSGSAVFGLIFSRKEAYALARQLKEKSRDWDVFVVRTV